MNETLDAHGKPGKLKLSLDLVLPKDAATCDACVGRMLDLLRGRAGLVEVHVDVREQGRLELCLHFDPSVLGLDRVRALVEQAGVGLGSRFEHLSSPVLGLRHKRQAKVVEEVLSRQAGVLYAAVAFGTRRVLIEFDPSKTSRRTLAAALEGAGILLRKEPLRPATPAKEPEGGVHPGPFGERSELIFSLASGALTATGWLLGKTGASAISTGLFIAA